jgi:predicted nucleotidyltransferase
MIYEEVFREFELQGVQYLLVGGVAVNIYGYVRMTMDLDIMVDLSEDNLSRIIRVMEKLGFSPRAPVDPHDLIAKEKRDEWINKKGAVVFTFIDLKKPFRQIDVFLTNPMSFSEAFARRKVMVIGGLTLSVACLDDLIEMKERAGRPRDLEDASHLKRIKVLREEG